MKLFCGFLCFCSILMSSLQAAQLAPQNPSPIWETPESRRNNSRLLVSEIMADEDFIPWTDSELTDPTIATSSQKFHEDLLLLKRSQSAQVPFGNFLNYVEAQKKLNSGIRKKARIALALTVTSTLGLVFGILGTSYYYNKLVEAEYSLNAFDYPDYFGVITGVFGVSFSAVYFILSAILPKDMCIPPLQSMRGLRSQAHFLPFLEAYAMQKRGIWQAAQGVVTNPLRVVPPGLGPTASFSRAQLNPDVELAEVPQSGNALNGVIRNWK